LKWSSAELQQYTETFYRGLGFGEIGWGMGSIDRRFSYCQNPEKTEIDMERAIGVILMEHTVMILVIDTIKL
jgi:hypothetical protein